MKKISLVTLLVLLISGSLFAQNLDQILTKHAQVMGYAKLASVTSAKITGTSQRGPNDSPFTVYVKDDKIRFETDFMGRKMVQVFDGKEGWMISPRSEEIQPIPERMLPMLKQRTGIFNPLVHWKDIRNALSYAGKEDLEGTEVYVIDYTHPDGSVEKFYIDPDSYVLLKESNKVSFIGNTMVRSVVYSDYKPVDGIMIAFSHQNVSEGGNPPGGGQGGARGMRGGGETRYKDVSFNVPIDNQLFTKDSLK